MKDLNFYTGFLFAIGMFALGQAIVKFNVDAWIPFLLVLALTVFLDLFPIKLPSGDVFLAGVMGYLLMLFEFGISACVVTFSISLLACFLKNGKIKWFRYFSTLGMYYLCSLLALAVISVTADLNVFLRAFLAAAAFEVANYLILNGIKKTVANGAIFENFLSEMRELLIPILLYTLVLPQLFDLKGDLNESIKRTSFIAVFSAIIIYFSYQFTKEIVNRKRVEEELRATKEQLESFFNNTVDAICVFDLRENIVNVNPAFEKLYGWTRRELVGNPLPNIPDFYVDEIKRIHREVKSGKKLTLDTVAKRKDGSLVDISVTLAPIYDAKGMVSGFASIARDITERKLAEEALRKSEAKYRIIAENTADLISIVDTNGFVKYVSPSHEAITGFPPAHFEGNSMFAGISPDDLAQVKDKFHELLVFKEPFQVEFRFQCKNGEWITLDAQGTPVIGKGGGVEQVIVVARDISERIKTQELLRKSDKLAVVGQLAAGIAHEIRNPLTSIRGFVQMLQVGLRKDEYLEIMLSEIDRMEAIISEFLVLARPKISVFKPTDLRELLEKTVTLFNAQAIIQNVQILNEFHPDLPLVMCDGNQLKQVFINILKNAIEAMPNGGTVRVSSGVGSPGRVFVRFADSGVGIPEERLKKLGEPFYSTKEKGTGLGLMISYKIIEEHQGWIHVESEVNKGTTVEIILPVAANVTEKMGV